MNAEMKVRRTLTASVSEDQHVVLHEDDLWAVLGTIDRYRVALKGIRDADPGLAGAVHLRAMAQEALSSDTTGGDES